jgi:ProP effector
VAQRGARREALQNAFKASGKTVAEFAEMYGLDPAEAGTLLG